ncbi:dual specificity protein kinase pom1 [Macroventuria anomochaeta]|uniref:Dual specificity protein kinase pom1 n=1 Tax=Macroventuria anomochaeta TaxID=301207 RepID=A0ACB6SI60_9PLEO|nr:dual specificity protein kinase pom1 [Macroventuria anomochaeta]KAF2633678.1 dual specificity protein kinase pom1 [Macroventuria anomochaeta]
MASCSSSTSEGEVVDTQHKANTISQRGETAINGSSRVSGLDGASDRNDYNYRALSRSPSPYRRKRTRSPSPYRNKRAIDRSPSPFRHGRSDRGHEGNDSRSRHKRKASPPRGSRPDKRHNTDRSRHGDRPRKPYADDLRNGQSQPSFVKASQEPTERPHVKPISYAEIDNQTPTVPGFNDSIVAGNRNTKQSNNTRRLETPSQQVTRDTQKLNIGPDAGNLAKAERKDVEMYVGAPLSDLYSRLTHTRSNVQDEPEITLAPVEDKAPTQETREEKRRRWAAIRAAAEQKPKENLLQQAVLTNASENTTPNVGSPAPLDTSISPFPSPRAGDLDSVPASPDVMIIDKQAQDSRGNSPAVASPSAADYDPTQDMLDDRNRALKKNTNSDLPSDAYNETDPKVLSTLPAEKVASVKKQKKVFDMFDFSDNEDEGEDVEPEQEGPAKGTVLDEKLLENWDDPEGYYKIINNELVNGGRHRMIKTLGRGVFANVAQAEEVTLDGSDQHGRLVAIKMIRRNELMRKASQKEMDFLQQVNEADPQDKRHIIRLLGSFDHKGHLCIIFEHMSKNLRDLLKEETNGHGLALPAVKTYARQMFLGLQHLQNCQVIHLDLKPDNVLVSADKKTVKLADFGTAVDKRDVIERTEYLVSRFYRAPEIILGMDIGYPVDMWAVGCTVYELWTGKILFTGRSNNQMIKAFMDCLGWPSEKLLKKGLLNNVLEHFEAGPPLKFISREVDQYNQLSVRKIEQQKKISRDIKTRVHDAARGIAQGGPTVAELNDFADLLNGSLHMNVEKRIQPKEALAHKFFASKNLAPRSAVVKPPMMKRATPSIRR